MKKFVCENLEELNELYNEPEEGERVPSEVQDTMYRTGKDRWEKRQAQIGSMEQIPVEEFDAFVDTLLDLPFEEAVEQLKTFINEHPYIHEELGELEGRDKYVGPYEKFVDNFRDEF